MVTPQLQLPERVLESGAGPNGSPLRRLFKLVARADSVQALRDSFVPAVSLHFAARRAALMLFAEYPFNEVKPEIRDNPVVQYLWDHHAPVHEAVILRPEQWTALCPWADHGHVLAGPIIQGGEMIGSLALTRARAEAAFNAADLASASALCLHLSAWFARWNGEISVAYDSFTPRERQIVELVAQGLTNAQIGERLLISPETVKAALKNLFRKTGVGSRAQLAAKYARQTAELP
jgi:DNA-binding CsgD family transcriptional regulator